MQCSIANLQLDILKKTVKWEKLAPLPISRNGHTAVLVKGVILYVGGDIEAANSNDHRICCRIDVYNLTTNQWSPSPVITPYRLFAMTVLHDKLVIAGGVTKNDEVVKKVLVLKTGQWKDYSEIPTARCSTTAVGYHSMLIVVGGAIKPEGGRQWTRVSTTELLDTTNGCWYICNNLPSPHQLMQSAIIDNELYLLGGIDKDLLPSLQVFVSSLNKLSSHQLNWRSIPNTPHCGSGTAALHNKFLLTVGGWQQSITSEVNVFNSSTGQWKHLTNIPAARSAPAVVDVADDIIVIGGVTNDNGKYSNTVWIGKFE